MKRDKRAAAQNKYETENKAGKKCVRRVKEKNTREKKKQPEDTRSNHKETLVTLVCPH